MAQLAPVDETLPVESATDWQAVVGVLSLIAAEAFVYGFSFPYFSLALRHVGLSAGTIGLNASLGGIGIVFVGPFIPRLLDRFGLRPLTIIQFTVSAVCQGSREFLRCDHRNSPPGDRPVRAGRSALMASRWRRMR
jgi:hypothetical protein